MTSSQAREPLLETSFHPYFPSKSGANSSEILVDTHVVVWLAFDQDKISKKAKIAIDEARKNAEGLAISDITLLELATLVSNCDLIISDQNSVIDCDTFSSHLKTPFAHKLPNNLFTVIIHGGPSSICRAESS